MASRRMVNVAFVDSDFFLNLPVKAQLLYFHLLTRADDDGFIDKPNAILRLISATKNDLNKLEENGFVYSFSTGIVVVVAWNLHNKIRRDMYKPTVYQTEKAQLVLDENELYLHNDNPLRTCNDSVTDSAHRTVQTNKDSSGKDSSGQTNECGSVCLPDDSISSLLTPEQVESLKSRYTNYTGLISLVDKSIQGREEQTPIRNPVKYIDAVANANQWNLIGNTPNKIPGNEKTDNPSIEGSLWDMLNADNKKLMEGRYSNIPELIEAVSQYLSENNITSLNGSPVSMFSRIAEVLEWPYKEEGE